MAIVILPCPFCNSTNVDPEGWASTERKGPACDDCGGSADTLEIWNSRPEVEKLTNALRYLTDSEARYRKSHDQRGDGDMQTGRAWYAMRRAGDNARNILRASGIEVFESALAQAQDKHE